MPSPLHEMLHSKHPGESWQRFLKRWLQVLPDDPHPMPAPNASQVYGQQQVQPPCCKTGRQDTAEAAAKIGPNLFEWPEML